MKTAVRLFFAVLATASLVFVGCGPRNTEPKPVNVKEDPRVKPVGINDGNKSGTQGEAPK